MANGCGSLSAGRCISVFSLLEFFRLHRCRNRDCATHAPQAAGELQSSLLCILLHRFLEPMAHHAVNVAENVCVQSIARDADASLPVAGNPAVLRSPMFFCNVLPD